MAKEPMPGSFESMVGGEDPEFSSYIYRRMMGAPVDPSIEGPQDVPLPRPRPPEVVEAAKKARKRKGVTPEDQSELNQLLRATTPSYKNGGMVDRAAIRGKTKGKIC